MAETWIELEAGKDPYYEGRERTLLVKASAVTQIYHWKIENESEPGYGSGVELVFDSGGKQDVCYPGEPFTAAQVALAIVGGQAAGRS
tara:strand:- start:524 stop:787 length:264 start_codon:yes stop_codon:yes gene_type:complete